LKIVSTEGAPKLVLTDKFDFSLHVLASLYK
jgi:hypothetical protein